MSIQDAQSVEKEEVPFLRNFFQIDVLKAAMIFLVIFDHFVSWNIKNEIGVALWERISIPVFLIILGFNSGYSFRIHGQTSLKELYSWKYFKKKIERYIIPFLILYVVSTFIGLFMYGFDYEAMYFTHYPLEQGVLNYVLLYLPFWGPGNWFISILITSIFVMPLLYWGFSKKPVLSLILTFVIEIIIRVFVILIIGESITTWDESIMYNLISHNFFYRISAVGLGVWFSLGYDLKNKRNLFMWIIFPLSLIYLVFYQFFEFRLRFDGIPLLRGDYNLLVFPYSAFIVLLALKFIPNTSNTRISKLISLISKSTYHILLTQMLGFGMINAYWGTHYGMDVPFNPYDIIDLVVLWITFIWLGIVWYKIQLIKNLTRKILYYINFFILFPSYFFLSFWAQGFWVPISLLIINGYAIALIVVHFIIKKPLNIRIISIWTIFLVLSFISVILQIELLSPDDEWILLLLIGVYFVFALCYSLIYKIKKNKNKPETGQIIER